MKRLFAILVLPCPWFRTANTLVAFKVRPSAAGARIQFPAYEVRTLDNGMQVVVVLHHNSWSSACMIVRAGHRIREISRGWLTSPPHCSTRTTAKSARQVQDEIDFMGGAMGRAGTDPPSSTCS